MAWFAGIERSAINWGPSIDPAKCVACGMCMNCGKKVFDWTEKGAVVARPYDCLVGCSTCSNLCLGNAITFPDIQIVRDVYKRENIWSKVKKQLRKDGIIT